MTRGRRRLLATTVLIALASLSGAAQARPRPAARHHARSQRPCRTQFNGGPIIFANRQAGIILRNGTYEGCWFAGRRRAVTLGPAFMNIDGFIQVQELALNGTMAATFEESGYGDLVSGEGIRVVDLKRRRKIGAFATGQLTPTQAQSYKGVVGVGPTTGLVVSSSGSVAWIVHDILDPDPPTYQVWKADRGAAATMLAAGNDIDPSSLALGGTTLYWAQGGASHASTLG